MAIGRYTPALFKAIAPRTLSVHAQVGKYLLPTWQPTGRIFSHALYVHASQSWSYFSVIQSIVHEIWVRRHSSSMYGPCYTVSDFLTFPFPPLRPQAELPECARVAESLYELRSNR